MHQIAVTIVEMSQEIFFYTQQNCISELHTS